MRSCLRQHQDRGAAVAGRRGDSALAMGLARETGSIERGKSADLIVLDRNLFKVPVEQLHLTQVTRTYFKGRQVFPAP